MVFGTGIICIDKSTMFTIVDMPVLTCNKLLQQLCLNNVD